MKLLAAIPIVWTGLPTDSRKEFLNIVKNFKSTWTVLEKKCIIKTKINTPTKRKI